MLVSSNPCFSPLMSYGSSPQWLNSPFWFRVCIWVLSFTKWAPLSFVLWIVPIVLCSCLCLFDAIVEFHAMDEKSSNDFLIGSESGFYILFMLLFVYVVEANIKLNWKA